MKKLLSITSLLLLTLASFAADETQLDAQTQQKVVDRVKEYCQLMQEFSADVEKIDNMETIYGMCENSNVSVFNDLTVPSAKDISINSMPLQQYMMMLTDKFENNVKTSFSGFKYLKAVVQPSPLEGFDAARYAFVKVDKQVDAPGIKSKQRLNIIVNTSTMKVSSTISEDFEDPQRVYLEALEKFNDGDYKAAVPLFEKVSTLQRFSGRFRAKTMLGWIYAEQNEYQKAYDLLRESSDEDPLGKVLLASKILLQEDAPILLRNTTEGIRLLQAVGDARDKDIPQMHLIAKAALVDATLIGCFTGHPIVLLPKDELKKLQNDLISDPLSTELFQIRGYMDRMFVSEGHEDQKEATEKADELIKKVKLSEKKKGEWDALIALHLNMMLGALGDKEGALRAWKRLEENPYSGPVVAMGLLNGDNLKDSNEIFGILLKMFNKGAEAGNSFSSYIVSVSHCPLYALYEKYTSIVQAWHYEALFAMDPRVYNDWSKFLNYLTAKDNGQEKSLEEFLKWNQKAIDLGSIDAMEDRALFEAYQVPPFEKADVAATLELACRAAVVGKRRINKLFYIFDGVHEYVRDSLKIPFENSAAFKVLKLLDEQGNGAASYLLYDFYKDPQNSLNDTVQAMKYLEKSKDAGYYYGMLDYAKLYGNSSEYDKAMELYKKLTVYPQPEVYGYMGDIEFKRKNYHDACGYYIQGMREAFDSYCCERLSDFYLEGFEFDKNLREAYNYINKAMYYLERENPVYYDESNPSQNLKRLMDKKKVIEDLLAKEGDSSAVSPIARLNQVLDKTLGEDTRIEQSQKTLAEVFASPKAIVKTVGSNGTTIVSTETAEDFMLRLATMKTDKKMVEVSSKKDKNNKLTELTIQMK